MSRPKSVWWDSDVTEDVADKQLRTVTFEATCLMCGRLARKFTLTPTQAHNRALVGLPACGECGGFVLLDVAVGGVDGYAKWRAA